MNVIWRKIRIGNTILAKWHITTDKQELPLFGRNLTLEMKMPNGEVVSMPFTITDTNIVNLTYEGKDQDMLGKYSLTLWENRGETNQHVVDACNAWQLVKCSCEADEQEIPNLELEVVELEGNLEIGGGGETPTSAVLYTPQELTDEQKAQARANINAKRGGYTRIEKIHNYIHEIWYDGVDYSFADLLPHTHLGACTSIRKGKFFARNLDWQYSECCEFFVHTPAVDGRHAVDGFGGNIPALTKSVVESGAWNAAYNWLPLSIADGHNDAGLCASMNVVPTKTAPNTYEKTTGTNPSKPTLNGLMIVRYILDNHTNALAAAEDIRDNYNVVMPHSETFDEELHFLIADKMQTIVLEFVGNEAVIIQKADQEGYITNFRLHGVTWPSIDTIEPFGQGVERYGLISSAIVTPPNITAALGFVAQLNYTNAYTIDGDNAWLTEFAGLHDELTVQARFATPSVYDATLAAAHQAYLDRTRDGQTWQTTHSVAYDIESGECLFLVQQDWTTLTRRDMVLPIDAYTKAETDALLAEKAAKTFIAVYGVTTFAEVKAAYDAGKTIICKHGSFYEPLVSALLNTFTFCTLVNKIRLLSSLDANGWVEIDEETLATASDLAAKQDTISDLSAIREGASAGATALQPADIASWAKQPTKPTYTASEVGALPSSTEIPSKTSDLTNDSGYTTQAYVDGLVGNILTVLTSI